MRPWAEAFIFHLAVQVRWACCFLIVALVLSATCAGEQVRLAWDENAEPDLGGYRVYYGTRPGDYSNAVDVGLATTGVVDDLQPASTYFFVVTAYNESGLESEPSEPISYRTATVFSAQNFTGLLGEAADEPRGFFTARLSASGFVTGRVFVKGKAYAWRGAFDRNGSLTVDVFTRGKRRVVSLSLQLSADGSAMTGTAETDEGSAELFGHAASALSVSPSAGRYTMALAADDSASGAGFGFGIINVSSRGVARFNGILPDGARFSAGITLDSAATAPLYVFQKAKGRVIIGRVAFRDVPEESDADGVLRLHRPGIGEEAIALQAARYPAPGIALATSGTAAPQRRLAVQVTGIGDEQILAELIPGTPMVAHATSGEVIRLRVSPRTGLFSGVCAAPDKPRVTFSGALYQKPAPRGFGRVHAARGAVELRELLP